MSENASVQAGEIVPPDALMQSIEDRDGVTVLPFGARVEYRQLRRTEPPLPSEPSTAGAMRSHRATRAYKMSPDQMARLEAQAEREGRTVAELLRGES